MKKLSILYQKFLRFLKITKPIKLDKFEVQIIKFCKGHYKDKYRTSASNWAKSFIPLFNEVYGYDANENYNTYLKVLYNQLLNTWCKIQQDKSGSNVELKEIIEAAFYRSFRRDYENPIERVIAELCGQIQNNQVIENRIHRYHLDCS